MIESLDGLVFVVFATCAILTFVLLVCQAPWQVWLIWFGVMVLCTGFSQLRSAQREVRERAVREWKEKHHIQGCIDSPANVRARKQWCDEGWKHVTRVGRHENPYQVCIGAMVEGQAAECERKAGGRP